MTETYIIVGGGQAGGWTAKTLRQEGFAGKIHLFSEEQFPPHERPPLSKEILLGKAEADSCFLWPPSELKEANIEMHLGVLVTAIDINAHEIKLENGEVFKWDKLMLATGGCARILPTKGINLNGIFTLRTIDDALAIRSRLASAQKMLVVGAGWIGLEVAAAARNSSTDVIVIDVADRVCPRALTPDMSHWLYNLHLKNGTKFRLETSIKEFVGKKFVEKAILEDGGEIDCDLVVVGIGLTPNTKLAEDAGLLINNGIVVDETGKTSHPDIFAAGDNTNHPNSLLGRRIRLESWENAQNQAIYVARSMLGSDGVYAEIPWFWSDQFDSNIQLMGLPDTFTQTAIRGIKEENQFIEFYLEDEKMVGAAAVNNPRDLRFTRRMITSKKRFDINDLADPNVKLQKLLKS